MPNPADLPSDGWLVEAPSYPPVQPAVTSWPHTSNLVAQSRRRAFLKSLALGGLAAGSVGNAAAQALPLPEIPALVFDGRYAYPTGYHPFYLHSIVKFANALVHMPYKLGGGHASLIDNGYDCSGALSYVLCCSGFLNRPIPSADFARYGQPGHGIYLTIFVRPGVHVFMTVCGLRFDTSDGNGPRWQNDRRNFQGFQPRRIPGL